MDRTFAEVRGAYQARREAQAWAAGVLDDAAFGQRLAVLLVQLAAAAWWQGAAARADDD